MAITIQNTTVIDDGDVSAVSGTFSGSVSASSFIGPLTGTAVSADTLTTARTINGTSFDGSADITTATWGTARNITIGGTTRSVNGSENADWTLADIGAASQTLTLVGGDGINTIGNLTADRTISVDGTVVRTSRTISTSGIATGGGDLGSDITVTVPGTDITQGTRTTTTVLITSSTGSDGTLDIATTTLAGVMSAADKTKLDSIETGAQVNVGTNLGITGSGNTRTITSSTGTNVTIPIASTSTAGWLSFEDKTKLDGIEAGAQVNVPTNLSIGSSTGTVLRIDSSTGTNATLPAASATISGIVTNAAQTFAGVKTFNDTITGSISGNAGTATTLQTARTINGTSFNGSANITTANWGTARTLAIGSTGKSVNGSGNVSWSLSEIGVNDSTLTLATSGIATGSQTWTSNQGSNATFTVTVPGTNIAQGTRTTTTVPITSSTGSNATLNAATTSLAGVMTSSDKTKLDGIETGAQVNVGTDLGSSGTGGTRTITSSTGNNTSITYTAADLNAVPTSRTISTGDGLNGGGNLGSNLTLSVDGTVVRTSGNQTIGGTKTFSGSIIVDGEARIFDTLRIDGQLTGTNTGMTIPTQGGQSLSIRSNSFSGLDSNVRFRQSGSGSTDARLIVSDGDNADRAIAFRGASGGGHIEASDSLRIRVGPTLGAATEAVRILSSGNVGINITSPSEKLHVDGRILATTDVGPGLIFGGGPGNYRTANLVTRSSQVTWYFDTDHVDFLELRKHFNESGFTSPFDFNFNTDTFSAQNISLGNAGTSTSSAVRADRTITTGDGLNGGGNLTSNLTLSVDGTVVRTSGNQTIGGTKTFSSAVVLSTAGTATNHAVRADRTLTGGDGINTIGNLTANRTISVDGTVVRTSGNQTISGIKTFNNRIQSLDGIQTKQTAINLIPDVGPYKGSWLSLNHSTFNGAIGSNHPNPECGVLFTNNSSTGSLNWGMYMGLVKDVASTSPASLRLDIGSTLGLDSEDTSGGSNTITPAVTVRHNSNVGIGTTSPTEKLHVDGNILASGNLSIQGTALTTGLHTMGGALVNSLTVRNATVNDEWRFSVNTAGTLSGFYTPGGGAASPSTFFLTSAGNLGIGFVSSPTERLHVDGKIRIGTQATNTTDAVRADRNIATSDGLSGGGNLTANLTLSVDGTVVRTSGNQTIGGTKTFSGSIIVDGEARIFDTLRIDGQLTGTNTGMTIPTQGGQSLSIRSNSFSGLDSNVRFRQSGSGSAAARLVVSDLDNDDRAIAFRGASGGGFIEAASALRIQVGTTLGATSEAVRILSSGNVGIGVTSPSEKLHVDGNIRVQSGDITLDNNRFFRIRDTANVARGIIHMSTANHVNFGNTQSTARMIIDGTGTGTLLRLNSNNTVSINGNIVGNAVTQSAYDTADSNRVTRVGDFGEGGAVNANQITDFTVSYPSGVYRGAAIASQMTGAPETANWTSIITIRRGLDNRHFYEWQRASGASARRWFGYRLGLTGAVEWAEYLHSVNTTEDSNGFIKAASPIVRLFDNKTEEPVKPVDAEFVKVNKGHYELHNVPPLSDKGWQIEVPQDHNGNRLVFVETEYDENTSILTIYTSKREWSSEMGIWVAGERKDIPKDRWVDLRFWESPEEENIEGE